VCISSTRISADWNTAKTERLYYVQAVCFLYVFIWEPLANVYMRHANTAQEVF
jgi:hypothetical protein